VSAKNNRGKVKNYVNLQKGVEEGEKWDRLTLQLANRKRAGIGKFNGKNWWPSSVYFLNGRLPITFTNMWQFRNEEDVEDNERIRIPVPP
jgi:hypothetical protein